jgi:hypothetical protein
VGRKQNFRKTTRFLPEIQSAFKRVLYQELQDEQGGGVVGTARVQIPARPVLKRRQHETLLEICMRVCHAGT